MVSKTIAMFSRAAVCYFVENNQMGTRMGFVSLEVAILEFSFFLVRFWADERKTGNRRVERVEE